MLTHQRLLEALDYDPATGMFRHKEKKCHIHPGDIAGSNYPDYVRIYIDGKSYKAHRLAWFYVTGSWPTRFLDHANGDKRDNSIANLREADRSENGANIPVKSHNTSGLKGVSWYARTKRWKAQIQVKGRKIFLGYHLTKEAAYAAFCAAAEVHFGEFARVA